MLVELIGSSDTGPREIILKCDCEERRIWKSSCVPSIFSDIKRAKSAYCAGTIADQGINGMRYKSAVLSICPGQVMHHMNNTRWQKPPAIEVIMFKVTAVIMLVIIASGCTRLAEHQEAVADVTSSPSGAAVYANGEKLGITPLHYELYKAFPAGWKNMMFQAQGVLMVRMDGCDDYTVDVNDYILSRPIHAELKCDGADSSALQQPAQQDAANNSLQRAILPRAEVKTRLKKLESLYQDGLITEDEYKATRKRILDEL